MPNAVLNSSRRVIIIIFGSNAFTIGREKTRKQVFSILLTRSMHMHATTRANNHVRC